MQIMPRWFKNNDAHMTSVSRQFNGKSFFHKKVLCVEPLAKE